MGVAASRRTPAYGVIAAGGVSMLGNAVAAVALPWFVLDLTGSAAWTGVAGAMGMTPLILGAFFGGAVVDRLGSRRVAVTGDLVSAACVGAIPVLQALGLLTLAPLLILIAIGALLDGPAVTAQESRYPELARFAGLRLERVTALDELIDNGAMIAGPILAGIAIATIGPAPTLTITAGCALIAAILNFIFLPRSHPPRRAAEGARPNDVLTGVRFLFGDPLLRTLLILGMGVVAIFGALDAVVMPVFIRESGRDIAELGWFLAAAGGGAGAGALGYASVGHRIGKRFVLIGCLAAEAIAMFLLAGQPEGTTLLIAGTLAGLGAGPLGPLVNTVLLRRTPTAIRGRVLGASTAVALTATPLAVLLAGGVIELLGTRTLLLGGAGLFAGLACLAAFLPSLRQLDRKPDANRAETRQPDPPAVLPATVPPTSKRPRSPS
jgi:macrolide resistance protein